jgi:glycosyltransferase involved in cell wall biosynthesis
VLRVLAAMHDRPEVVLLTTEQEDRDGLWDVFERHPLPGCQLLPSLLTIGNVMLSAATRKYRLDVVFDPNGIAPFFGPRYGAQRMVTIHDATPYVCPEAHNRLDTWRYHYHLPYAARRADHVLTVSECSRRDLARYFGLQPERVHVAYPGTNHARFAPQPDGPSRQVVLARYGVTLPYILYVGSINGRKNIARIFEAYAQVRERFPAVRLVIGGKREWQTGEIDATFQRLNLAEHVRFTGYINDQDLPALYSAAELFVFPSIYEGFGSPVLEGLACGVPVLTSQVSSLPEVAGDAAVLVDPYDVAALAQAIERVLSDRAYAAELRAKGLTRARQFSWTDTVEVLLGVSSQEIGNREQGTGKRA